MPAHWTYESADPASELEQGDILAPTEALRDVFSRVHPHFSGDKYLGFLITTQSCDLVRRKAATPNAAYVNLASIRPLSQVLRKILSHVAEPVASGVFPTSRKREARQLLQRLLNQNEQSIGLFFLHTEADAGIGEPAVAFLRVTVALRSEHYDILRQARVGRLNSEFRAKLGWLVGNLYIRPATKDWEDVEGGKRTLNGIIEHCVSEVRWLDDEIIEEVQAWGMEIEDASDVALEALRPKPPIDRAADVARDELMRVMPGLPEDALVKFQNRLRNSGKFRKLFPKSVTASG